jgi:hypothetical protein
MRAVVFTVLATTALASFGATAQTPAAPVRSGQPANVCRELVNFLREPAPAPGPTAPPSPGTGSAPATQAPPQAQTMASGPAQAAGPAVAQSGLSAPVPQAGPGTPGPQAAGKDPAIAQGTPQPAPTAAPAAPGAPPAPAPKPSPVTLEQAEALLGSDNLRGCRDAAQQIRRAGVKMPESLIALAALDPKFFDSAASNGPPPEAR